MVLGGGLVHSPMAGGIALSMHSEGLRNRAMDLMGSYRVGESEKGTWRWGSLVG